jgi:DNA polymerase III subunit delta'
MDNLYNWNIVGHKNITLALEETIKSGNVSHAYLFAGSDSVGKFTVAKTFAHILQCPDNFCRNCPVCREIDNGTGADTIEIGDDGESIKIDRVRSVLANLNMSKHCPYKILLIKNIERMGVDSANAILKTLEDPPENVIFLLTTSRLKDILPTIVSRVRVYNFSRLPESQVREVISSAYPLAGGDLTARIVSYAMGRPGRAIRLMQNSDDAEKARKMFEDINVFINKPDISASFAYISRMKKDAKDQKEHGDKIDKTEIEFLDIFVALLRKKLLNTETSNAEKIKIISLVKEIYKSHDLLKRNVNARLLLENLMLNL